jgi:hypothetical protein
VKEQHHWILWNICRISVKRRLNSYSRSDISGGRKRDSLQIIVFTHSYIINMIIFTALIENQDNLNELVHVHFSKNNKIVAGLAR